MSEPIIVTGTLSFDPANREAVISAMRTMMETTRAEDGNVSYTFSADLDDPGTFHVSENWASPSALDAHNASPHMADFMAQMGPLGMTGASITMWSGATPTKLF
ncbi:MAG: antibiotic biosynthesis monooxygenase [Microthrixaceae bacterium]|nr:antibiotic biosynthesis monooxygenase [Microthrixaceae bacterium]